MSTTFGTLKTRLSLLLQDPDRKTFTEPLVEELIFAGLAEVGRLAPEQFTEDLTPVAGQLVYAVRSDDFGVTTYAVTGEADTDLLTSSGHGLAAGHAIKFANLAGGTGLTNGTTYYVISTGLTADDFKVSTSVGGSAVNFTTDVTSGTWQHAGSGSAVPEIELTRVEVWDPTQDPDAFIAKVPEAGLEYTTADSGWSCWGGELHLPTATVRGLSGHESDYVIRLWGYSPYVEPATDTELVAVSKEVELALLEYAHLEAIRMLLASRNLFTQWQTRSGNTDMSPAGLMNEKNILMSEWRQKSRAIQRLRARV